MKLHLKDNPNLALTYAGSANLAKITDLFVKGCGSIDRLALLKAILATPSKTLKYIAMELGQNTGGVLSDIDTIYQLLHETSGVKDYGRVTYADGQFDHTLAQFPELTGSLTIQQGDHSYDAKCAEIQEKLGFIITMLSFFIQFEDPEVERVLKANGVGTAEGITAEQLAAVTSIGTWFRGNTTITAFPELADTGIVNFGEFNFEDCYNLTKVRLKTTLTSIAKGLFSSCSALSDINLPATLISIGDSAFGNCSSLKFTDTGVIVLPESLTALGGNSFRYTKIVGVTVPNGVTAIRSRTFSNCPQLTTVVLGNAITYIDQFAFGESNNALRSFTINTVLPPTLDYRAFSYNTANLHIYVPASAVADYQAASGWSVYASIISAIPE